MARSMSLKRMAVHAFERIEARMFAHVKSKTTNEVANEDVRRAARKVLDEISVRSAEIAQAQETGEWIKFGLGLYGDDGSELTVECLPDTLQCIADYKNRAAADVLTGEIDEEKTAEIPARKIFTPTLFPNLDYERARRKRLVLGKDDRVEVGDATPEQWLINDNVRDENWKGQQAAHKEDLLARKQRTKAFRDNPDCRTTDDLVAKLYGWKSAS